MSDTEQSGDDQSPATEQTAAPEGRLTSYAPGHGPNGPFLLDEEAEAEGAQKAADLAAIERVMVILHWVAGMIEEGKLSP